MKNTTVFDKDLNPVLEIADSEDLAPLVEYVSDKFSEDLTSHDAYKKHSPNHEKYADLIAKEVRDMGGNSFANVWRGEGPSYHEVVCDVAKKLKAPYNKEKSIEDIENSILETILKTAIDHMSEDEKRELLKEMGDKGGLSKGGISTAAFITIFRAGGFYSYQLTLIIANQIARMILGHGLKLATNAGIARIAGVLTGPIGWAITGIWTAIDLAGPAYKVTIPCVIHVAMLRKKLNALNCDGCGAILPDTTMKFCPECGKATAA
ncbi:ubiquinol-cytochrome C chaperone family protein [Shewanella algae]|uniref:ubiquinol-cytochrome C chaperone family protein n=1 Tax=Shewanella algae TaxID=38313 RepID=UPI0031F49AA5